MYKSRTDSFMDISVFSFGWSLNSSEDKKLLLKGLKIIYEPSREKIGGFRGIFFLFINGSAGFISSKILLFSIVITLW